MKQKERKKISDSLYPIFRGRFATLPREVWQNRRLVWKLAKNDFRKRYAGSSLGVIWALIQPIVTVAVYYVVFDKVFNTRSQLLASGIEVPYVLFLTCGIVPWFFFHEGLTNSTQALIEYNYLVKKVVFNVSILPVIKLIAAAFIHVFFLVILIVLAAIYGYYPTVYTLQIIYYSVCAFLFILAAGYVTSAVVVFFKDLTQIIAILLQVGMWATPILWDVSMIPGSWQLLFKLNPVYYLVLGFRNAIYGRTWFFEHTYTTIYFWVVTVLLFCCGTLLFRRMRPHFADVL
ncbi:MAG: ABC transporter permease [Lachnospiraceae bacterium]|jgi:teichoic acid transport system permease protein|nr:ABC transporter permease [Lachnospiraceae bacterium]